jgi:hypothetical protein
MMEVKEWRSTGSCGVCVRVVSDQSQIMSIGDRVRVRVCSSISLLYFSFSHVLGPQYLSTNNLWKYRGSPDPKGKGNPSITRSYTQMDCRRPQCCI